MPRSTDLTPELQARFCELIGKGLTIRLACQGVGIDHSTFYDWLKRAEAGEQPFSDFSAAYKRAEAEQAAYLFGLVSSAAVDTWQAAAWVLERRHGMKAQSDVSFKGDIKVDHDIESLADKFRNLVTQIATARGAGSDTEPVQ